VALATFCYEANFLSKISIIRGDRHPDGQLNRERLAARCTVLFSQGMVCPQIHQGFLSFIQRLRLASVLLQRYPIWP
jgi:hypothetical protein